MTGWGDEPRKGRERTKIVLATRNLHKVEELSRMLAGVDVEILTCRDFPSLPEVVEDGATLEENAIKKAEEVSAGTGLPAVADDTGLEVDALGGAPGVFSARYAGPEATYDDNNRKLLTDLAGRAPAERRAVFRCVVAVAAPGAETRFAEGRTEGTILEAPRGDAGFGYDPVFLPDGHDRTYAEMTQEEKNALSHRGKAMRDARGLILGVLTGSPRAARS